MMKAGMLALLLAASIAEGAVATHEVTRSVPASQILRIVVDVPAANVKIRNSEEQELRVVGRYSKSYRGNKLDGAQKVVDAAGLRIETAGPRAIITRDLQGPANGFLSRRGLELDLEIFAPKHVNVEVKQRSGDVKIDGSFRDVEVNLAAGDVSVRTPKRNVRELVASSKVGEVNTNVGDRTVTRQGLMAGSTYFMNDDGSSSVKVAVRFGRVDVELLP